MFTSSPRYLTLTQQVALSLEQDIRKGVLRGSLPGERQLAESMQVSRRTIKAALVILQQKKLIRRIGRIGTEVLRSSGKGSDRSPKRIIRMLLSKPLDELKPFFNLIDKMRAVFYTNGFRLETHFGHSYLLARPAAALETLVRQYPCDGWILGSANRECQAWFHARGIPTVLHGTAHEGIPLPFVDIDMMATSLHATNVFLRKGHRSIGLVVENFDWAGYRKTEQGFVRAIRDCDDGAVGNVLKHRGDIEGLKKLIGRILKFPARPTALFIVNPYHYIAVSAILATHGLRVPQDISLLCRDDDVCLRYLPVEPSRYTSSANAMAKRIFSLMSQAVRVAPGNLPSKSVLMVPEFVPGESIADRR